MRRRHTKRRDGAALAPNASGRKERCVGVIVIDGLFRADEAVYASHGCNDDERWGLNGGGDVEKVSSMRV
jgi:hypothetical protein